MRDLLAPLLARLGNAEVRRLTQERDQARSDRSRAAQAAVRWHAVALIQTARADALVYTARAEVLAEIREKESTAWQ